MTGLPLTTRIFVSATSQSVPLYRAVGVINVIHFVLSNEAAQGFRALEGRLNRPSSVATRR